MSDQCIFCKIINRQIPSAIVHEDDERHLEEVMRKAEARLSKPIRTVDHSKPRETVEEALQV